jgi:predicted amidohydrolase
MQDINAAILQFDQVWEDKQKNFSEIKRLLNKEDYFDLLLLPEMFHTGFTMNHQKYYETMQNSEGIDFMKSLGEELNCAIYTSLIIEENGRIFNRGVFIYEGETTHYDKRKCFGLGGESDSFTSGQNEVIVNFKGWKLNLQICYDLRFPELIRNEHDVHGTAKYDALLYVANWPKKRINHWLSLLRARAIENQCYVIACNRVGVDGNDIEYNGSSLIIDPNGIIQNPLDKNNDEGIVNGNLSAHDLSDLRKKLPFLQDR